VTLSQNLLSFLAATLSTNSFKVGRAVPVTPSMVGARRPSNCARSSILITAPLAGRRLE
jgi:hypothetical protein